MRVENKEVDYVRCNPAREEGEATGTSLCSHSRSRSRSRSLWSVLLIHSHFHTLKFLIASTANFFLVSRLLTTPTNHPAANLYAINQSLFSVLMLTSTGTTTSTDIAGDTRSHLLHQEHHAHSALFRAALSLSAASGPICVSTPASLPAL